MMFQLDLIATRQHFEDIQREAQAAHLANRIARMNGRQSLISRMAKQLAGFGRRMHQAASPKAKVSRQRLASAKPR